MLISSNTDGVAVILTIITMLSTPILTSIFGDGSLEVCKACSKGMMCNLLTLCVSVIVSKIKIGSELGGGGGGLGQLSRGGGGY